MKFKIGKVVQQPDYRNQYKVVVKFMYGDADGEGEEEILIDKDSPYLERFLNFLDACERAYPHGRGGGDDYNDETVKDWWLFSEDMLPEVGDEIAGGEIVTEEMFAQMESDRVDCDIYLYWHNDPAGDGIMSSYDGYEITFFDENGIEHEVEIEV